MLKVEQEMKLLHLQSKTEMTTVTAILPSSSCTSPATFYVLWPEKKTRTKHWHHAFTSHWSSRFSICVHLSQHSSNATETPKSHHLADIRNVRSSRNSSPSLLRCYLKLFSMKWASLPRSWRQALASFSQPSLFLQQCHLGEADYRPMTRPTH